jgi:hypothetical protein
MPIKFSFKYNMFSIFALVIYNFLIGIFLILILILLQNPLLGLIYGSLFILLNFFRFSRKFYKLIIFLLILPLSIIFSINIIMLGIDPNVPAGFKTPIPVGLIIILPVWVAIFFNFHNASKASHDER